MAQVTFTNIDVNDGSVERLRALIPDAYDSLERNATQRTATIHTHRDLTHEEIAAVEEHLWNERFTNGVTIT